MLSASVLERAAACPPSEALPHTRSISWPAERGTEIHAFLCDVPALGRDEALSRVAPDLRRVCEILRLDKLPTVDPKRYAAEVALAYNFLTDTARELGRNIGRRYLEAGLLPDEELPASLDVLGLTDEAAIVIDYKSGRRQKQARRHLQLRMQALAAARAFNKTVVHAALLYFDDDGEPVFDYATFDILDLAAIAEEVSDIVTRVDGVRRDQREGFTLVVTEGPHCEYCPAWLDCSAKTKLIRRLATETADVEKEVAGQLEPARAKEAYRVYRNVEDAYERMKASIKAYATVHPIELDSGKVYGPVLGATEEVDGEIAFEVLPEAVFQILCDGKYVPPQDLLARYANDQRVFDLDGLRRLSRDLASGACSMSTTKAAINRLAKDVAPRVGEKISRVEGRMLEAIREAGGIAKPTTSSVREHRPKSPK